MFDNFASTPERTRLNSNEIAMRARAQDHKLAQMVAGYRKATSHSSRGGNPLRKLLTLLTSF